MKSNKEQKRKGIEDHNRKYDKQKKLLTLMEGHKRQWIVCVFGSDMSEEQIDNYISHFENKGE